MGLGEITKQASSFLQEKYQTAKLVLTDVTRAESLAEEATNSNPCSPDARTMMRISEAAFDTDDYWRVVDVLHRRLNNVNWKEWRPSYKSLVLLEFLLTHGPEDIGEEFHCDVDVIQELGTFEHVDDRGFDWGSSMRKKSERILKLIRDEKFLQEARSNALRVSREIKGFGNLIVSPSSSSSSSSPSFSKTPRTFSFGSHSSSSSSSAWNDEPAAEEPTPQQHQHQQQLLLLQQQSPQQQQYSPRNDHENSKKELMMRRFTSTLRVVDKNVEGTHVWDTPIHETGSLVGPTITDEEGGGGGGGAVGGRGFSLRSFSNLGKVMKKKMDRQLSLGF